MLDGMPEGSSGCHDVFFNLSARHARGQRGCRPLFFTVRNSALVDSFVSRLRLSFTFLAVLVRERILCVGAEAHQQCRIIGWIPVSVRKICQTGSVG
jgi:hypothetical protein